MRIQKFIWRLNKDDMRYIVFVLKILIFFCSFTDSKEVGHQKQVEEDTKSFYGSSTKKDADSIEKETSKSTSYQQSVLTLNELAGSWIEPNEPIARFMIKGDSIFYGYSMRGWFKIELKTDILYSYLPEQTMKLIIKEKKNDTLIIDSYGEDQILVRNPE